MTQFQQSIVGAKSVNRTFLSIIYLEIRKDRWALTSAFIIALIVGLAYSSPLFISIESMTRIELSRIYQPPSAGHWLGTDDGGRDVFGQLLLGARNSLTIGICVTLLASVYGIVVGLLAGYYGGMVDQLICRVLDFLMILPSLMIIIVFIVIVPDYSVLNFILIMSAFAWFGKARLVRSRCLAEREVEYIQASKTLGTPHWKVMLFELLPNISSLIIVNMTLTLAGNIGLETGLTFLGFGLPSGTPSLGTLIALAKNPHIVQNNWWVWLPAALLILVIMLCINYIGQAVRRAADARQRLV
ncbi:ABC transporter permease [Sporosarcina sp. PTS2304]|uniref:ABC transporter permease n=1 Tax=Sporosarcina sp. PTS2304 TaxID=2283194 RepID=UPI000E0CFF4A|nr:ABC transporter permease [Sporosarcina sp. PTS2304]AXI00471.1 ABC transporter permease [Sporosarcina sp. PTS2304]